VVRAVTPVGVSPNSGEVSATTSSTPAAPTLNLPTAVSASRVDLSWSAVVGATRYTLYRSATSGSGYSAIAAVGGASTAYSNTGLSPSTTYFYLVRVTTTAGVSPNSNEVSATTQALPPALGNLMATAASSSQINLTWDPVAGATRYTDYRSTTPGGPYVAIAAVGSTATTYANKGLAPATTYYYVVRVTTSAGVSPNSNEGSATTI
jgi:phosphodiesterase/alkaline phosphatase D-like protein